MFILLNLLIHHFIIKTILRYEKNIYTYFFLIIFLCFIITIAKNVLYYEKAIYFIEMLSTVLYAY